ncbi:hypothetical protein FH966_03065 [Lentibacillus cibarius]|uniref:Uncharacterized protein n=1 Tax=Lentibacillus cibarius TaxID=2583219 RepID=A0A549YG08_9BACI|nr:hypothetical protein [Lentibacillus cibarius]TRM10777.1 hypothetical protein FH966_03065 [Lentibacillus cibarius]
MVTFKRLNYITIIMTVIALISGIIFFFFSSWSGNSNIPGFPIFIIMILTSITGMIFGITDLAKSTGKRSKIIGTISVGVGIGFLIFLALIIWIGSNFAP